MPVSDAPLALAEAAAEDGIALVHQPSFDWACEQGHFGLLDFAVARRDPALRVPVTAAVDTLTKIYAYLKGDSDVLRAARSNRLLSFDLVHEPTGTLIEVDESVHFTSFRLGTLDLYPPDVVVDFDLDEYRALCREWAPKTDRISHGLAAKGWGFGGIQKERAYQDALRDLATHAMGYPPLMRFVALDGDGAAAYQRDRDRLSKLLRLASAAAPMVAGAQAARDAPGASTADPSARAASSRSQ